MKQKIYFRFLFAVILLFANAMGFAQVNHITMSLENCTQPSSNTIEFDLIIVSDGDSTSDLRLNAISYGINFDTTIVQSGATITPSYISGTSDISPPLNGFNFITSLWLNHIRLTEAPFSGGNTGNTMVVGHQYRVGRFMLTCSSNWVTGTNPNFSLQTAVAAGHTICSAIVWIGNASATTGISSPGISVGCSLTLNCNSNCPPSASFQANNTIICTSSCVNFTDLSSGSPTSWQWFFPGATPNSSTQQNPTNICYNTAGTYSVTLVAGNANGYDTLSISPYMTVGIMSLQIAWLYNASCGTCNDGWAGVNVLNGVPPIAITWYTSPIQNGDSASNLLPGTYSVCAIDAHGCTACTTVHIDSMNCSGYSISTHGVNASCSTCSDGSASVSVIGGISPFTFTWSTSPVQTTDTATSLSKGTYDVCVTDHSGCTACDSATIGIGFCRASYNLYPDSAPHTYTAVNTAIGVSPIAYLWSWGDGTTDTAAYPNHVYPSTGYYSICLSIADNVGCTSAYCDSFFLLRPDYSMISVNVISPLITGVIPQSSFSQTLKLFPNPTNGAVVISYSLPKSSDVTIRLYNSFGQLVNEVSNGLQTVGKQETVFDTQKLAAGIYFIKVSMDGNVTVLKLVKM